MRRLELPKSLGEKFHSESRMTSAAPLELECVFLFVYTERGNMCGKEKKIFTPKHSHSRGIQIDSPKLSEMFTCDFEWRRFHYRTDRKPCHFLSVFREILLCKKRREQKGSVEVSRYLRGKCVARMPLAETGVRGIIRRDSHGNNRRAILDRDKQRRYYF